VGYLQIRRTNRRLHFQKRQIESQAEDLRNINESLQKANIKIKQKNALIEEKNEDLTRLNNEKNHIIGILAHDLRNPLATAISMNEPIQSQHNELSEEQYEAGSIITRALRRMNEMINKILDIRAIETKKLNLDIQRTNMFFVIQQVCELFRDRFAKRRSSVSSIYAQKKPMPISILPIWFRYLKTSSPMPLNFHFPAVLLP
jgi:signal transduction histidine kinase